MTNASLCQIYPAAVFKTLMQKSPYENQCLALHQFQVATVTVQEDLTVHNSNPQYLQLK